MELHSQELKPGEQRGADWPQRLKKATFVKELCCSAHIRPCVQGSAVKNKLKTNPTVYFSNLSLMWGLLEEGEHERASN